MPTLPLALRCRRAGGFLRSAGAAWGPQRGREPRRPRTSAESPRKRSAVQGSDALRPAAIFRGVAEAGVCASSEQPWEWRARPWTLRLHPWHRACMLQHKGPALTPMRAFSQEGPSTVSRGALPPGGPVVIVVDIESTDLLHAKQQPGRIVQFAARDLAGGSHSAFMSYVNPGQDAVGQGYKIHGITNQRVQQRGVPGWNLVAGAFVEFVEFRRRVAVADASAVEALSLPDVVIVAHNGDRFDFCMLRMEHQRCGLPPLPADWLFLDSLVLARAIYKGAEEKPASLGLGVLYEHFKVLFQHSDLLAPSFSVDYKAHDAMADVDMLVLVLHCLLRQHQLPPSILARFAVKMMQQ